MSTMKPQVWSGFLAAVLALAPVTSARADTAPTAPTPPTVSADLLPAPQIDGVAWAQVVSGNRVYVVGRFGTARPYGAASGTQTVTRSNILAYDLTTGALVTTWAPSLNGQGLGIAASPDGSRIYVTGEFTQVNGVSRARVAALSADTGALVTTWAPSLNYRARPIVVTADTVYVGGAFSVAANQARSRMAAFSATTGALLPFKAEADNEVFGLALPPGSGRLVLGGRFTTVNGTAAYGLSAVNPTTGATLAMPANQIVRNAGTDAAIYSLTSDATRVYGTGYVFGSGGNFEGTFAASATTGALSWVDGCMGDTYSAFPVGPVLYSVSHAHNCGMIGFFPEQNPRAYQRAMASTSAPAADGRTNTSGPFTGRPAAESLHWLPTVDAGSFTGQTQGAWSVTGTSDYVLLGGEFPRVNGIAQQGLARFAVSAIAPDKEGPRSSSALTPTLAGVSRGTVRVTWKATWDRDNRSLTYEVLRGSTVIATVSANSAWWSLPQLAVTDSAAPPGTSQTYRVRVRDPFGNSYSSGTATITVPS
jgi:hypothetical protein